MITWGVDGHGVKHYLCDYCELVFGPVDPDTIWHECDRSQPKGHNRDKELITTHQPKGSMCMSCKKLDQDCSTLNFSAMPVMEKNRDCLVVKCSGFVHDRIIEG